MAAHCSPLPSDLGQTPLFPIDAAAGRVTRFSGDGTSAAIPPRPRGAVDSVARPRHAARSLSASGEGRTAPPHQRERRSARCPHARHVRTVQFQGLERRNRLRLCGEAARLPSGPEISDRVHRARRPAGRAFQNQWNWRWNAQAYRGARLRRGDHRLPRLAGLRPGIHRFDQPALGGPPVRGPAEGSRGRATRNIRGSMDSARARSAPRTAATCRTGSRATGRTASAAS